MLERAIRPFSRHHRVRHIVVALPGATVASPPDWLSEIVGPGLKLVTGGETRAQSVKAAFEALDAECTIVLVHDAARPFVSDETIDAVMSVAASSGALPAVPVSDTIKRGDDNTRLVMETIDRSGLWKAQTPQGCPREMLQRAYEKTGPSRAAEFTDESALLEAAGFPVQLVPDTSGNFKVTTEDDFAIAEALLRR
jgi:2-C-methyl-D-erythritol 4-phosphate cytidylyltransferase